MHFHFPFTAAAILWTLTFAAHLVLLVVLIGRERIARFPWFTASVALTAFRLLAERLLSNRLPRMTMIEIVLVTSAISVAIGLLVLVELARRSFGGARRVTWVGGALALMAAGVVVLRFWGSWPAWEAIKDGSPWQLLQLMAQKGSLLLDVETIAVGLLVAAFGYRYNAGWRSHAQRIVIGLSTAAIGELGFQAIWESIVRSARANLAILDSMAERNRIVGLGDKLSNANSALFVAVLIWWIVTLWFDEPWAPKHATEAAPSAEEPLSLDEAGTGEAPDATEAESEPGPSVAG